MSEISKAYEPQAVEEKWYAYWQERNIFTADASSQKPAYSIVIPPPNVTGVLHMGHVLNNTIQDVLARKARMDGKEVLWLPGTDHAGIATEGMVAKQLRKEEKKTKQDIGREEFLKRVWTWKDRHGGIIISQLKKLGCSCDWSRERFTMDPEYVKDVQRVFVDLYKKDFIYRGKRMVNWDPSAQTALSDEEVEMQQRNEWLYTFSVGVVSADGNYVWDENDKWVFLKIATTRPETIPGDVAIAVNPKDPRYSRYIGKFAIRPLPEHLPLTEKLIPIIGDNHVEFEFGTGVLKVTPCHDKADFEIAIRHGLSIEREVIGPDGKMLPLAGELAGLDRDEARGMAMKLLLDCVNRYGGHVGLQTYSHNVPVPMEEPYTHNVGLSQRTGVKIESRLSEQWFLKYPSVQKSKDCVAKGKMSFHPERWAKVYDHWLTNIQDWCISRQLWWGHRVPIWTSGPNSSSIARAKGIDLESWLNTLGTEDSRVVYKRQIITGSSGSPTNVAHQFLRQVAVAPGREDVVQQLEDFGFTQDPDVLDTWFSSWLWPFATMGWPEPTPTLKKFYPTTDLVTGPDIIFFWVARMIMAGYEFMGDMPFRNVYFTGIIRDKQGRKMSKTLGNSPDPLELIAKYGADALRFGTMRSAPLGQDVLFDEKDVELGRNFCNKLWNACRFRQMQAGEVQGEIERTLLMPDDKWILLKLDAAIREMTESLAEYKFSEATATIYRFFWSEYCDWYLEATKAVTQGNDAARKANTLAVIDFVLSHILRLFHPFLPFITEDLWHGMGYHEDMPEKQGGESIMFAPWPKPLDDEFKGAYGLDDCYLEMTDKKYELVTQGRNLRREARIQSGKKAKYILKPAAHVSEYDVAVIKILLNAEPLELNADYAPAKGTPVVHSEMGDLFLPLEGVIDVEAEKARLQKELEKINAEIVKVEQKLNNPAFTQKVPVAVLAEHQKRLVDWQAKKQQVEAALKALEG